MKNLPDKIYLSFDEMSEERFEKEDYKELCEYSELVVFNEHKFWETDVEYTRYDAFIEKACDWLRKGGSDWYLTFEFGEDDINFVKLAEDFKTYMKGE